MSSWSLSDISLTKLRVIADIQQLTKRDIKVIVVLDGGDLPVEKLGLALKISAIRICLVTLIHTGPWIKWLI